MPTYDYRCNACRHEFELFQPMTEAPKRKCPNCAKNTIERLIGTGAAVLFKGSGFYQTDYRSESYKKSAEADTKPAAAPSSDANKSADKAAGSEPPKPESKPAPAEPKPEPKTKPDRKRSKRKSE